MDKFILQIAVDGHFARCLNACDLPVKSADWIAVHFAFSSEWNGMIKNAVFSGSGVERVVLNIDNDVVVPWECCTEIGSNLMIGVNGHSNDGVVDVPTLWVVCGKFRKAAHDDAEPATPPTPDQIAQVLAAVGKNADDIANLTDVSAEHDFDIAQLAENKADKTDIENHVNDINAHFADGEKGRMLSQVQTASENASEALNVAKGKQNKLKAGANITIDGDEISATGGGGGSYDDTELRQMIAGKSPIDHNHDGVYQPVGDYAAAEHTHTTDDISDFPGDEIAANTAARHTHGNKSVIDGITAERVENWDKALTSGVSDVTIDGNSVVNDGVADIPVAATGRLGVIQVVSISGLKVGPTGILTLDFPTIEHASTRLTICNRHKCRSHNALTL